MNKANTLGSHIPPILVSVRIPLYDADQDGTVHIYLARGEIGRIERTLFILKWTEKAVRPCLSVEQRVLPI